jgi:uracil-DNA glycosylase
VASAVSSRYRDLHQAIYNCRLCRELGYYAERVQPRWDPSKARRTTIHRWGMLIGQAPGKTELKKRKAFQGAAGGQLWKWLEEAGFSEDQVERQVHPLLYKTSLTKCYPGKRGRNDRKPTKKEVELCTPFLRRQIQLITPRVLIPMGVAAIQWFFPDVKRLGEVVGRMRYWRQGASRFAVICLPHPSPGSRWLNAEANRKLVKTALRLLFDLWTSTVGPDASSDRKD